MVRSVLTVKTAHLLYSTVKMALSNLTDPKGADGKDGASAKISVKDGVPGVDGQPGDKLTRIVYEDKDGKHTRSCNS